MVPSWPESLAARAPGAPSDVFSHRDLRPSQQAPRAGASLAYGEPGKLRELAIMASVVT